MDYPTTLHHALPLIARADGARYWRAEEVALPEGVRRGAVVLASVSPRRRELLRRAGVRFEAYDPGEDPALPHLGEWQAACLRAAVKAGRGAHANPGRLSLGADTVVVYGGHTLGKPKDEPEATGMLRLLSGQEHEVYTAFCLAVGGARAGGRSPNGRVSLRCAPRNAPLREGTRMVWLEVVRTAVRFRELSEGEIEAYVASRAPLDKAGGYGIQDREHRLVERIRGSYYNVVGLPVREVRAALRRVGWEG